MTPDPLRDELFHCLYIFEKRLLTAFPQGVQ